MLFPVEDVSGSFSGFLLLWNCGFGQAPDEDVGRRSSFHATALVGPLGIVVDKEGVEVLLHGFDVLVELPPSHDPEVLVEQGPVQALDEAAGLRSPDLGRAMLDLLELQEQLVGVAIGPAAELAAVVAEHGANPGLMGFEGWQHVSVQQVDRADRQLVRVEPSPSIARVAVRIDSSARPDDCWT